ncbi:glycosyltransferase family 4 protein [uncultured Polaribacter sp.]|uniref:MraY family glycosyltransferase n=1 Tax=uncultured Polaribacter sp. TaxID=174711 RepID=UPI00259B1871|nr:glycosyltransferase family 4 protein [uncultured Polaribacter sp.]
MTYFLTFIILVLVSFIYLNIAVKFKIIDKPNQRSSHKNITIRGGGIIFPLAVLLFYVLNDFQYTYFVIGTCILAIISFLDDIYSISSKLRFSIQLIGVLLLLHQVGLPFLPIYMYFLYLLVGLGFINVYNFMDGINGITGLYALAVTSIYILINHTENFIDQDILIYLLISLLIFGFYNFRKKALFFAGDIGSISLGFLIVFLLFSAVIQLEAPIFILSVFIYGTDGACTMLYRKFFTNEKWTEPHRHHIYQKLVDEKKWSHLKISFLYMLLQLLVNIVLFYTYKLPIETQWFLIIFFSIIFIFIYVFVFRLLKKKYEN